MRFTRAIVRRPGENFAQGITCADDGPPDLGEALRQHEAYCAALVACGLVLTDLDVDLRFPDGTFVEDTAVITARGAVVTRPGAATRRGEADCVGGVLEGFFPQRFSILAPGTVDGGDVCQADEHFLIGLSARTNEAGAKQLQQYLERMNYSAALVDIRDSRALLHLKTGIAYLGDDTWVTGPGIERDLLMRSGCGVRHLISVAAQEAYAANCVRVNDSVLVPAGFARMTAELRALGLRTVPLEMSEFKKMDGGLSCLSLRF